MTLVSSLSAARGTTESRYLLLGGISLLLLGGASLFTGEALTRSSVIDRAVNPVAFRWAVGGCFVIGAALIGYYIYLW